MPSTPTPRCRNSFLEHVQGQIERLKCEQETIVVNTAANFSNSNSQAVNSCIEKKVPTYRAVLAKRSYWVRDTLGSGTYSKVKSAYRLVGPRAKPHNIDKVAVKIIDRQKAPKDYQQKFLPREIEIWPLLKHPNIVKMIDHFHDNFNRRIFMVLEYAEGGDCLKYIQRQGSITEEIARDWICQVCDAVAYMHNMNICHRDLKLENLLLDCTKNVKLCDFGFVRWANAMELSQTYCGSKSYAAPEILQGEPHDPKKADIWAIGVILYIFVTGKMPFDESKGNRKLLECHKKLALPWNRVKAITDPCRDLILSCFSYDYRLRPTIDEVTQHPWFFLPTVRPDSRPLFSAAEIGGEPSPISTPVQLDVAPQRRAQTPQDTYRQRTAAAPYSPQPPPFRYSNYSPVGTPKHKRPASSAN